MKESTTNKVIVFVDLVITNLNKFCPLKQCKLGPYDKPFITTELKKIARQRSREYQKRGKSQKYIELKNIFEAKYEKEATKYLEKTMKELREAKSGQAFSTLKRLGAPPGDLQDAGFSLPSHEMEGLSEQESAERIADHFAHISQEFHPLNVSLLPKHVQEKLQCTIKPPTVSEFQTYKAILAAKKPKS